MRFPRVVVAISVTALLLSSLTVLSAAQQVVHNYQKGQSYFPNPLAPYSPQKVAAPNLSNSPRIDTLMHNGEIMLSLDDAIAMGLENNLAIAIAR